MSITKAIPISLDILPDLQVPKPEKKTMYVDNDKLSDEMVKWRRDIDAAKEAGLERPPMPDYVGAAVLLIAENFGRKPCYRDYSWLSEMISDGVEACCMYLHNFKVDAKTRKGKPNAFGYISIAIERAFHHRIELEKRQDYYKGKSLEMMGIENFAREVGEDGGPSSTQVIEDIIGRVYEYEGKQKERADADKIKMAKKAQDQSTKSLFGYFDEKEATA